MQGSASQAAQRIPAAQLKPAARRSVTAAAKPPARSVARSPASAPSARTAAVRGSAVKPTQSRAASTTARTPNHVQSALNATKQFFGAARDSIAGTAQQVTRQAQQVGTQVTRQVQQVGKSVVTQAREIERSSQGQAVLRAMDGAVGVAWRGARATSSLNPVASLATPLAEALSPTPVGQMLAKTPLAKAVESLDHRYGDEGGSVPTATRAEFLRNVEPKDRAEVAATARQIVAQQRLVLGDRATESAHDDSKSLLQGGIDQLRWVVTGRRDDMDHLLSRTENRLDRLQHDVMTGKVSAAEARRQLAATTKGYYG
ncbi:MAG: hypothetical protein ACK56I_01585, partial [bacterium]